MRMDKSNTAKTISAKNVDEYLHALPEADRTQLEKLRQAIKMAAPKAEEVISYQIPTYKYKGPLVHFAAFENHCSLIVISKNILEIFEKQLKPYTISGRTIHFTSDKPIPAALVQKIVKTRIKENEERITSKKTDTGKKK
jgi:uncharacterized protein YdhG (YjbR/CyaY superfamily)